MKMENDKFFGEVISTYSSADAIEDGVLMNNPRSDLFSECNLITTNLYNKIKEMSIDRNKTRIFELSEYEQMGAIMNYAKYILDNKCFRGDNDENFFTLPGTKEGTTIWFVRNEYGKLTAMLPEDY